MTGDDRPAIFPRSRVPFCLVYQMRLLYVSVGTRQGPTMVGYQDVLALLGGRAAVGKGVKTVADLDAAVSAGLPRAALDHVVEYAAPPAERAKLRNRVVPRASYQRRRRLSAAHSAATERLARVAAMARWVWEDDQKARQFLWRTHPELRGRRPIDVALTELGAREVEEILARGIHGLPV